MAHISWTKGEGWNDRRIEPYAPLKLDPGASVLHYAQEIFEGAEGLQARRRLDLDVPPGCERRTLPELGQASVPAGAAGRRFHRLVRRAGQARCGLGALPPRIHALPASVHVRVRAVPGRARRAGGRLLRDRQPVRPVLPGREPPGEHLGGGQVVPHRSRRHRLRQVRRQLRRLADRRVQGHRERLRAGVLRGRRHQDLSGGAGRP